MYSILTKEEFYEALKGSDSVLGYDDYVANPYHLSFGREFLVKLKYKNMLAVTDASAMKWKMEQIKQASEL